MDKDVCIPFVDISNIVSLQNDSEMIDISI